MALMLTRDGIMSRMGGYRAGARGLLRSADSTLRRELPMVRTSEIALSSFTFGVLQGRFKAKGGLTFFALPVDLLAGATFHILGLFPFTRPYAHHLHAFGDGALASFFTTTGYRVGERWGQSGSLMRGMSGIFGDEEKQVAGGSSIADKELASLVRAE
jgi:hypothetical protein